jgi:hypothetical protein
MPLIRLQLPIDPDPLPQEVADWIAEGMRAVQAFQDIWDRRPIEQFVAADYELVYRAMRGICQAGYLTGNRFGEWGCGFGVIAGLAASLGFDAIGIEAEHRLLSEARKLQQSWPHRADLYEGNFLPTHAEQLATTDDLPSLAHDQLPVYGRIDLDVDDFAMIYAYPWPGEEEMFLESVFEHYAANGALLLLYHGSYDLRLWRKVGGNLKRKKNRVGL